MATDPTIEGPLPLDLSPSRAGAISADVLLTLVTRITVIATGIVTAIVTARALGPSGRGEYVYVTTLALLAVQFANVGLSTSLTRSVVRDPASLAALTGNTIVASLLLGLITAAAGIAYHLLAGSALPWWWVAALIVLVPATLFGTLASNLMIGLSKIGRYNGYLLGSNLLQLAAIAAASLLIRSVPAVLWANAVAVLAGAVGALFMLRSLGARRLSVDAKAFFESIGYSGRVYVITLLGFAAQRANILFLAEMSSSEQVGLYSVAMQFADSILLLPGTIALLLFPRLLDRDSSNRFRLTTRVAMITGGLLLIPAAVILLAREWLIVLLFGPAFEPSAQVLLLMLPGVTALGIASIFSQFLAANGVPLTNVLIWIAGLAGLIVAAMLLIPPSGAVGASLALSAAYLAISIALVALAFVNRHQAPT